ncbi:putative pectate lyase 9 [Raphanus sativus]|nr:putative pectate lyase 9 [Raphanus sativus]
MASSSQKLTSACFVVLLIFVVCALTGTNLGNNQVSLSRRLKTEDSQSCNNSTFAIRHEGVELNEHAVADPDQVANEVSAALLYTNEQNITERRKLSFFSCGNGNLIDDCWRCDPNWHKNRKRLADCGMGFGSNATGGRDGRFYVVTDPTDEDMEYPKPGTLRHAVIQVEPLWIIFKRDMVITLKQELIMNSYKTIDARGANVHIANGACITIQGITHVIVHGLHIHDCIRTGNAMVRSSPSHYGMRNMSDGSTAVTISNNHLTHHNEVMLLGNNDLYTQDKIMKVTIAYNHFGEGLRQRMPRCRHGYFHVVNNDYTHWEMYATGGSANPTINSQGNRYAAPKNRFAKEVTKRVRAEKSEWKKWNWRSEGDMLVNGAFFRQSGGVASASYESASSLAAKPASMVDLITSTAGALGCRRGKPCY